VSQQPSLARQVVAVLGRTTPALRPATGKPKLFGNQFITVFHRVSSQRPVADRTRASRSSLDDYRPGAWKVPAAIGGFMVSILAIAAAWTFTPAAERSHTVQVVQPLPPFPLVSPISARPMPVDIGDRVYYQSVALSVSCETESLTVMLAANQYQRFSATLGVAAEVPKDRIVQYMVQIDGVTRAEGQVSSVTGPARVDIPVSSPVKVIISGTVVKASPTTSCAPIVLGVGSPGFWND
jgi:hypothetical protein